MEFTDWKSEFNQFYRDISKGSLVFDLINLDWKSVTWTQIYALSDDIDYDINDLSPDEYCALLPVLLDAISDRYLNLLESHTLRCLLAYPETRLQVWEKHLQQRKQRHDQDSIDRILISAAAAMNVEFDPNERPRNELLAPYNERQRIALRKKIASLLELSEHHLGYDEHPFSSELETLLSML